MKKTTIGHRYPAKPTKHETFHNSGEFSSETSLSMLQNFVNEASEFLTGKSIVTVHVDQTGANLLFTGRDYQLSLIYTEGGLS